MKKIINGFNMFTIAIFAAVLLTGQGIMAQEAETTTEEPVAALPVVSPESQRNMRQDMRDMLSTVSNAVKKVGDRRTTVLAEDKDAAALAAEIAEMENALKNKKDDLNAILAKDAEFVKLNSELEEARSKLGAARNRPIGERTENRRRDNNNNARRNNAE